MATTLIGTLRPHAKGVHVQANAYNIMDVVTSADGSRAYMAVKDVPAGTALDNAAYWCIYTDVSAVKTEMEAAAERADASAASANEAILNLTDYTSEYALRVRGEIAESAGNPVTIAPDEGSLIRPVTVFSPKQTGSGDPSPDNVRPISGWDSLGLNRAGKNLFGGLALADAIAASDKSGTTKINEAEGTVSFESVKTGNVTFFNNIKPNTQYTVIVKGKTSNGGAGSNLAVYYNDGMQPSYGLINFSNPSDVSYGRFVTPAGRSVGSVGIIMYGGITTVHYDECGIFEGAVTLEDFEPFIGDIYTALPGQTVYGGRIDWNKGEMLVTHRLYECDGSNDELWGIYGALNGFTLQIPQMIAANAEKTGACSIIPTGYYFDANKYAVMFGYNNNYVYFMGCYEAWGVSTLNGLKAWLAGNPIQIVYRLAKPFTIQPLTPHQILALKGNNTLYGDGDTIETLWVKPLETSIKERTEPLIERIAALEKAILNG